MATQLDELFARRRSLGLALLLLGGLTANHGESVARAQSAGKPGAAKKAAPKPKAGEWHGEAAPREVVPGEKVLTALIELGTQRMSAGRYDEAAQAVRH